VASPEGDSSRFSGLTPQLRAGLMTGVAEATGERYGDQELSAIAA